MEEINKLKGLKGYLKNDKYSKEIGDLLDKVVLELEVINLEDINNNYSMNNYTISYDK